MDTCGVFGYLIGAIDWWWYTGAVVVAFAVGALWYSVLFSKAWIKTFKVEMPEKISMGSFVGTMSMQLVCTAILGFALTILTMVNVWLAVVVLVCFCAFEKGTLIFEFANFKKFLMACLIRVGYMFIAGVIFILFALI